MYIIIRYTSNVLFCFVKYFENFAKKLNFSIESFGSLAIKLYLCTRFQEQGNNLRIEARILRVRQESYRAFRHIKKEFFEKIYINRVVVQEASLHRNM